MIIRSFTEYSINTGLYSNQDGMILKLGALHIAWIGYIIAKNKGEYDRQIQYASIIQKLQKELNLEASSCPQLGLYGIDDEAEYEDNDKYNTQNC
jgi:hypothetical protein